MQRFANRLVPLALAALAASPLHSQARRGQAPSPAAVRRAAESIAEASFRERGTLIAHDSMRGRDTPSPGLDKTAEWVASEFRRIGLRPGGDQGSYIQRYQLRRSRLDSATALTATAGGASAAWRLGRDVAFLGGTRPAAAQTMPLVLLSGVPTDSARPFGDVAVRGAAVLHVAAPELIGGPALNQLIGQAIAAGVAAWIVVADVPAARWTNWLRRSLVGQQWELVGMAGPLDGGAPQLYGVRDSSAMALLEAAGQDLAALRASGTPTILPLAGAQLAVQPRTVTTAEPSVPNVVGVLEGSDPALRAQAVAFVAHMDHVGVTADGRCAAMGADSICNGANDNAAGTVGVVELAEAYASLRPRPRRSTVFVAVSGEELGIFGSGYYTSRPAVPMDQTVAVIGMDEIARNTPDSMIVVGKRYSSMGEIADRIAAGHPELGLLAVDDLWPELNYFQRSDHYPFALRGVPALVLYGGPSAEVHRPNDAAETTSWEKAARVVRFAFYVGLDVANADGRPEWDPQARARTVRGAAN